MRRTRRMPLAPVATRLKLRSRGINVDPPTEAEKHDAIRILKAGRLPFTFGDDPIWEEAQRILDAAAIDR